MPDSTPDQLKEQLIAEAKALGFDAAGVAAVEGDDQDRSRLLAWLARGYHASMSWMARDPQRRTDVGRSLLGARSVISLAINYQSTCNHDDGCGSLKVSRYAWGEDYHRVVSGKLKHLSARLDQLVPGSKSICCVDTAPIMERAWAERAGIGWIGRNGSLITRDFGSWVFLAEIVTTAELPPDKPHEDFCGSCGRCVEACPTEALVEPYVLDANKCVAYWTVEHRDEFPEGVAENFDGWIFGCDVCQEVCPWNSPGRPTREPRFEARCDCLCPPAGRWEAMTEDEFAETFSDSAIRRARRDGLVRNIRSQTHHPLRVVLSSIAWEPLGELDDITFDGLGISGVKSPPEST